MTGPLRVGMNLLWLRPGIVGGSENAATATVAALVRFAAEDVELHAYAQASFLSAHPKTAASMATSTFPIPTGTPGPRVVVESTWLPWAARRDRIDVMHWYGGVVPPGPARPSVLTVHDVQPLEHGAVFTSTKKRWLGRMLPRSVAAASLVAVPSAFVRDRLVDLVDVDPAKIVVIPHGLDRSGPLSVAPRAIGSATIRERFRLDGPYVLYPAITYPHKNHRVLIEAFAQVVAKGDTPTLVLTGGAGPAEREVAEAVEAFGIGDRVRRTGRVTGAELSTLMTDAAVLAFPSRYEGFGLPVLEALGVDTPVVASSAGSLPEIVGDAGVLVDPDDVDGWADALRAGIDGACADEPWTSRRSAQVERFEWERTIPALLDMYRTATQTPGRHR